MSDSLILPDTETGFRRLWTERGDELVDLYATGKTSFVAGLLPGDAVRLEPDRVLGILRSRLGPDILDAALDPMACDPDTPMHELPPAIRSPVAHQTDGRWLRRANTVGINVRTVGSLWGVPKYLLTQPAHIDTVHLLPIWEPGVVDSLYGIAGWGLNDEFFSEELASAVPHLDTTARQLRAMINLLHATGRTVGMDVIPHTDRFAEPALAQPHFYEWMRRDDLEIVDHRERLYEEVQRIVLDWLAREGPAVPGEEWPDDPASFFGGAFGEERRCRLLFGTPEDRPGRNARRGRLVEHLYSLGFEPVPATMGVPFRGLRVDPGGANVDDHGMVWRDFLILEPQTMSRVFNPLARFRLFGRKDDNRQWEIDFDRPVVEVWEYVCERYADVQRRFGFDFMRGDMSHVQMRPEGVPAPLPPHYDILGSVKETVRRTAPWFGYFAESFLPPRDTFGYGEEMDHLEASRCDSTLGDLQSLPIDTPEFAARFRRYLDLLETRSVAPNFTVMTADKDDPRFDEFYVAGNEIRAFIATFLTDMPSYVGLGFEVRDVHHQPAPNEHYTKLFVFHEVGESNVYPSKARRGPYHWGSNAPLFAALTRIRSLADEILPEIADTDARWLLPPDPATGSRVIAWTQTEPRYLFIANLGSTPTGPLGIPLIEGTSLTPRFSTAGVDPGPPPTGNGHHHRIESLESGEGRVFAVMREAGGAVLRRSTTSRGSSTEAGTSSSPLSRQSSISAARRPD